MPDLPPLTRRTVLRMFAVAAVGLLAGCRSTKRPAAAPAPVSSPAPQATSSSAIATPTLTPQPTLSPDELLAKRVASAEAELVAAYDSAASQHPELASLLAPFRADHAAHADALVPGSASPPPPSPPPSSTPPSSTLPSSTPSSTASPSGSPPSGSPSSISPPPNPVLTHLADAEHSAAAARIDDLAATTGSLASLLASIGGCEAAHAALLATARPTQ
ncbi:MAG TPA: hypothetical protein VGD55_10310 [Acidothermaceae bacterium]